MRFLVAATLLCCAGMPSHQQGAKIEVASPIRGVLIDNRDSEPIPNFAIDLSFASGKTERIVSDAEGRFESLPHERERLSLVLVDDDRSPRPARRGRVRLAHDPAAKLEERRELRIEIGPTYAIELLDLEGAPIPGDEAAARFHAEIFHDPPRADGVLVKTGRGGWTTEPAPRAPLRVNDGLLWTRFRDLAAERRFAGGPWWLEVRDEEGLLAGGTRVEAVQGVQADTVRVQLSPRSVFEFEGERSLDAIVRVQDGSIQPLDGSPARWLHPGRYTITARDYGIAEFPIELQPQGRLQLSADQFPVGRADAIGSFVCRASERTAIALEEEFDFWLQPTEFPLAPPLIRRAEAEVRFEVLQQQSFRVTCSGGVPWDGWVVGDYRLSTPASTALEVQLDIDTRTAAFTLLAVDSESGGFLEDAEFRWQHGGYVDWTSSRAGGRVLVRDMPIGAWAVQGARATLRVPGYIDHELDLAELVEHGSSGAYRVPMKPGWSTVLVAYDRRTREPLEGVLASLDGRQQAVAGADGRILLRADALPARLDLELKGYRWVDGDIDWLRQELLAQEDFEPRVWFAPDSY